MSLLEHVLWASLTRVVLLDPGDAVLVHLLGFLGQHGVLEVGSVEAHREAENQVNAQHEAVVKPVKRRVKQFSF